MLFSERFLNFVSKMWIANRSYLRHCRRTRASGAEVFDSRNIVFQQALQGFAATDGLSGLDFVGPAPEAGFTN